MLVSKNIGGQKVAIGDYWNITKGERVHMAEEGVLPGDSSVTYYRVPTLLMLMVAPVLGLVFAMFLPFIGMVMLAKVVAGAMVGEKATKSASFGWSPQAAYLSGAKGKEKENSEAKAAEEDSAEAEEQKS